MFGILMCDGGTCLLGCAKLPTTGSGTMAGSLNTAEHDGGNMTTVSISGTLSGTMTASAAPTYRYSRQTNFTARLVEPATGRAVASGHGRIGGTSRTISCFIFRDALLNVDQALLEANGQGRQVQCHSSAL